MPNSTLDIHTLSPDEWREYRDIRLRALQSDPLAFGYGYDEEVDKDEAAWKKDLEGDARMYAARIEGKIVAIAGVRFSAMKRFAHNATIFGVFVDPAFRKRGIGEALMGRIIADLRADPNITRVMLGTEEPQKAAQALYKKLGFRDTGTATKHMKVDGVYYDSIRMELLFEDKFK